MIAKKLSKSESNFIFYTPQHVSRLIIIEIKLIKMRKQCLSRRIDNTDKLKSELSTRAPNRNKNKDYLTVKQPL